MSSNIRRWVAAGFFVFVLCLCFSILWAGTGMADENASVEEEQPEEIEEMLGDLTIHSYEYQEGQMRIEMTWNGDSPTSVTLTEMMELDSGGSADIGMQTTRLVPGERAEITISAEERAGGTAAVLVSTPESLEDGSAVVLQDGTPSEPMPAVQFQSAALAVGLSAAGAAGFVFVFVLRNKHSEERGKERVA